MANKKPGRNLRQTGAVIRLGIMALILIMLNILTSYFHTGLDLTKEKRFTLSDPTIRLLKNMPETAVIDVYMKGKFPADLQRMEESVRERLTSFKSIAGNKVIFHFIDPLEGKNEEEQKQVVHDLSQMGIKYMQLNTKGDEEYSMKIFFPFALVQYNGKSMAVPLLENGQGKNWESYSEAVLEYKFANAINQLERPAKPRIAYMTGNGEPLDIHTQKMLTALPMVYDLDSLNLMHMIHISNAYDAIIINQPTIPFSGPDKLKIDQYVMRGGHVLWVVNPMRASLDSFVNQSAFLAVDWGVDLDDILFKYGIRVNNDLIEDMQCLELPRTLNGQTELHPWVYFPRFNPNADNPIVKNMDFIKGGFSSSIDTLMASGIKKTVLLQSSEYSRTSNSPLRVSLSMMSYPLRNELFQKPYRNVAILLEGKFHSVYQGRLAPDYLHLLDSLHEKFKPVCDSTTSQIVVSVGDVFRNDYTTKDGALSLGYYEYTGEYFANMNFLLNCMEYLTDKSGILEARSKDVKLRLLDEGRVKAEKTQWQWINVSVPIVLVLFFASAYFFFRKRRYEVNESAKPTT